MSEALWLVGSGVAGVVLGVVLTAVYFARVRKATAAAREHILSQARTEANQMQLRAREETLALRDAAEKQIAEARSELKEQQARLERKEDQLDQRQQELDKRERLFEQKYRSIETREQEVARRAREVDRLIEEEKAVLQRLAGLSREEATRQLLDRLARELEKEQADRIRKATQEAREQVEQETRRLILMALQRYAAPHTAGTTVAVVDLPNEEMKGRIIGREGRNIRSFERACGVDVVVDDTPGMVVLSAFDGVRRELARRSMEKLVADGRIHPSRIEEVVEETKREMEDDIIKTGRRFLEENGITRVHPKLVTLVGRLRYRTSYGQNVLEHIGEVGHLCAVMAAELGLDPKLARRCGIFHDIGKAVDQEFEGSHPVIGAELLKRFDEPPEVVDAAASHHNPPDARFPYTILAATADAISASRPGARGESKERYLKRLETLEQIARSFAGVESAYAIQAGRELRVIVNPNQVSDERAWLLAREIANEIERQLTYPGDIRVTLLRETRVVEYAR